MTDADPDLRTLLADELRRHLHALREQETDTSGLRSLMHSVKGTAGMAGERALSEAFARLERRADDPDVVERAQRLLASAVEGLDAGQPAYEDPWPVPPADLRPATDLGSISARYRAEMRQRCAALEELLDTDAPGTALEDALRHIHAMKGAASSTGDEVTSWFCHGLEARIRVAWADPATAKPMLEQLAEWRPVLVGLVDDPVETLEVLRSPDSAPSDPKEPGAAPSAQPDDDAWLQVPGQAMDLVLERLRGVTLASRRMQGQGESVRKAARALRGARQRLMDARRCIGPPRPWGAPAAALDGIDDVARQIGSAATELETIANRTRSQSLAIQQSSAASHHTLGTVRRATMSVVFQRVEEAVVAMAAQAPAEVYVEQTGGSTPVDRRLADALVDPVLQLVRNAVAHGIEEPSRRQSLGKPRAGRILVSAEVRGAHLLVGVRDDGAGVDVDALRADAVRSGRVSTESVHHLGDESLVDLLCLPGLTTRTTADLLAGRGLGLDVALKAARRLGGTIRIRNRPGRGFTAIVDVPLVERGQAQVLWVRSLGNRFALTARYVLSAHLLEPGIAAPPALATWIDPRLTGKESGIVIDIGRSQNDRIVSVSVAAIEGIEQATVRPVPPLVALAGPYVGVIVGADGHPSLLIDALLVSDRATGIQGRRRSSFPPPARTDT